MPVGSSSKITYDFLKSIGWVEKSGIMVRFPNPRIGWKSDGTLIIGYHEYPKKVFDKELLLKLI